MHRIQLTWQLWDRLEKLETVKATKKEDDEEEEDEEEKSDDDDDDDEEEEEKSTKKSSKWTKSQRGGVLDGVAIPNMGGQNEIFAKAEELGTQGLTDLPEFVKGLEAEARNV